MCSHIQVDASYFQSYRLFVDLDGVLVDFEKGVQEFCGKPVEAFDPRKTLWQSLVRIPEFYARLPWMPDGKQLWHAIKDLCPAVLTGIPRGAWAEPQKRSWCSQNLGDDVEVFVCQSSEKATVASTVCTEEFLPILIDDRISLQSAWESIGGVFIHHKNASESLEQLQTTIRTS